MSNVKELLEGKTFKFQIENGFKEALEDMSDSLNMLKEYVDSLSEEEIKCLNDKAREYCNKMEKRNKYNFKKRGNDKMDLFKYLNKNMMERYVKEGRGNIENRKLLKNDFDFLKIIEYNNKLIKERIHLEKNELVRKDIEEYVKQTDEYLKQRIDNLLETLTEPNAIDKYIERKNAIYECILQVEKEFKRNLDIVNSISTKTDIKSELI